MFELLISATARQCRDKLPSYNRFPRKPAGHAIGEFNEQQQRTAVPNPLGGYARKFKPRGQRRAANAGTFEVTVEWSLSNQPAPPLINNNFRGRGMNLK